MGAFLLVGVAGFGINNVITDLGSSTVARVGSQEINSRDFLRAYQGQLNQVAQQIGRLPTNEEAINFGIPSMVLQEMAQEAALNDLASNFGIGVSENKLGEMLRNDPSFAGTLGTFEPANFKTVLQYSGMTESEYFSNQSDVARRQQLVLSLFGDTKLPETASTLINRYVGDQRTIDYFALNESSIETPAAPTEDELAAYLTEHQNEFRTVETRSVQMLRLSVAELAASKTIADDEIAAEYERTKANLTKAERRTIQQVVLNADQVAAFTAGKAAGTSFDTLVAEAGLTPTNVGTLAQTDITDTNLAKAAFELPLDGFAVIPGVAGQRAVHVSAIDAGGAPSLADVRDQIAQNLAQAQARTEIAEVQDQVEELRAAFRPLGEIATRFDLKLYEADVTPSGAELSVLSDISAEDRARVNQAISRATEGQLTAAIPLAGNGNLYFDLTKIEPARDQTLDEVRDAVTEALTTERTNNAILAATAAAVSRLDQGETLADVAASYNVFPQLSQPFTRFGSPEANIDAAVAAAAFAGGDKHHGTVVSQDGEFIVFQVEDVTPAEGALDPASNASIENEARVGIYSDFVTALRDEAGLRVNQQALEQTLTLYTGQ